MSRLDSLKEAQRGTGATCQCGKPARLTVRGQTLCYECFDHASNAEQPMRERIREIDRRYLTRTRHHPHPAAGVWDGRGPGISRP